MLDLSPILSGKTKKIALDYAFALGDGGVDVLPPADVEFPDGINVVGEVIDRSGDIALEAHVSARYVAQCARCLESLDGVFAFDFDRTVVADESDLGGDPDAVDECLVADENGCVDFDRDIAEELMLEFPSTILCRDDCPGLCPKCGKKLAEGDCGCSNKKEIDPRLAILQKLLEKDGEK